jgi:mannose-1-phosphate guanylyltransferase/mannose-6-phosphate isomerase
MKTLILAGGSGTRLFPLSRELYPKQFIPLFGSESLFQKTVRAALSSGAPEDITIVTNEKHRFLIRDQLDAICKGCRILAEPEAKNTLPAVCYGISEIVKEEGDCHVAVLPSDHLIEADERYYQAFHKADRLADDYLVTFGIPPASPNTGYGYIRPGEPLDGGFRISSFVEKPDLPTAEIYCAEGYLWNSGIFVFDTALFCEECERHAPRVAEAFTHPAAEAYTMTPKISIDYGVMEHTDRAAVVPLEAPWSDMGSFEALYTALQKCDDRNAVMGEHLGVETSGNLIVSDSDLKGRRLIATIGVSGMAIIDTRDALLVCPLDRSQEVGGIVNRLKEAGDERADIHLTVYRPWGSYTGLEQGERYKIKRITVPPGKRLSLQMHHHRSEHWVVVKGTARVRVDGEEYLVTQGESTFVPAGKKHRLANAGLIPLEIIEVQLGEYVGEDDIIRFEDDFDRTGLQDE